LQAEEYETAPAHDEAAAPAGEAWAPADGLERTAWTLLFNMLSGIAFSLIAAAASLLTRLPLTTGNGALWGLAGFSIFMLSPSAGLPPELPGMAAGELAGRQLWWWGAVTATAAGIGILALIRQVAWKAAGIAVIALPHIFGAPHAPGHASGVPAELANAFAANALVASAIFWMVLGVSLGYLLNRKPAAAEA
jgi:cobalt transporter subunit CbtA